MHLVRCTDELWYQIDGSPAPPRTLREGVYQAIFRDLLQLGYEIQKVDLTHCSTDPKDIPAKKGSTGYDGYKKVKGNKLSALVDRNGFPLACAVAPANVHYSPLYEPKIEAFETPGVQEHPSIISLLILPTIHGRSYNTTGREE